MNRSPQNIKYKKMHKKRYFKGIENRSTKLKFGYYGLKAITPGLLDYDQIESGRRIINRKLKRSGKIWIRIFPTLSISKKPIEVRMGKGKGNVSKWIKYVKPGTIIYEINNIQSNLAKTILKKASLKLPFKTKIISKNI